MAFERRGVGLPVLQFLRKNALLFHDCSRVLLKTGETAIIFKHVQRKDCATVLQVRSICNKVVERRQLLLANVTGEIKQTIKAAIGDRVLVTVESAKASSQKIEIIATVIKYDEILNTYDVIVCSNKSAYHEANHALKWASGSTKMNVSDNAIKLDPHFSTKDATEELIKPLVQVTGQSLVEYLNTSMNTCDDAVGPLSGILEACKGNKMIGTATVFISHAWKYSFSEFAKTVIENEEEDQTLKIPFVWIDICTVNQVKQTNLPNDYFYTTFRDGISTIGTTRLILHPWYDPIPLQRSWCLWEIISTSTSKAKLSVSTSKNSRRDILEILQGRNWRDLFATLASIDLLKAEAFKKDDQQKILAAAQKLPAGISGLNQMCKIPILEWLFGVIMSLMKEQVFDFQEKLSGANKKVSILSRITICLNAGILLNQLNKNSHANSCYAFGINLANELDGDSWMREETVLALLSTYGGFLLVTQNGHFFPTLYLELSLEGKESLLGKDHPDTLISVSNLALLYSKYRTRYNGYAKKAEDYHRRCIEGYKKHGDEINLLKCERLLATHLKNQLQGGEDMAKQLEALKLAESIVQRSSDLYKKGSVHSAALFNEQVSDLEHLASCLFSCKKYKRAEVAYRSNLQTYVENFGPYHTKSIRCRYDIALCLRHQGLLEEATAAYLEVQEICQDPKARAAMNEPRAVSGFLGLAGMYFEQGKYSKSCFYIWKQISYSWVMVLKIIVGCICIPFFPIYFSKIMAWLVSFVISNNGSGISFLQSLLLIISTGFVLHYLIQFDGHPNEYYYGIGILASYILWLGYLIGPLTAVSFATFIGYRYMQYGYKRQKKEEVEKATGTRKIQTANKGLFFDPKIDDAINKE